MCSLPKEQCGGCDYLHECCEGKSPPDEAYFEDVLEMKLIKKGDKDHEEVK